MFTKILIANRGEIACRVARTARRMGVGTVAIYSDADARALHVDACDEAYRIGPPPPRESYLEGRRDHRRSRSNAAHRRSIPATASCRRTRTSQRRAPRPASCSSARRRPRSRRWARSPRRRRSWARPACRWCPATTATTRTLRCSRAKRRRSAFPVLIKATAGGGGKGMKIASAAGEFAAALASAQREAKASFGDDRVLIEKYLSAPRHIEIQVFADTQGQRGPPVRARLQRPAAPPEGAGGGARARHDGAASQRDGRCRDGGGTRDRLRRRRHRRVHRRAGRHVLLHGDEHAAAGRAPGHRDDHRPRPGRVAVACCRGRAAAEAPGRARDPRPRAGGAPLRGGPGPRLPAVDRHADASGACPPANERVRVDTGVRRRRRSQSVLRPDAREADRLGRGSRGSAARRCWRRSPAARSSVSRPTSRSSSASSRTRRSRRDGSTPV